MDAGRDKTSLKGSQVNVAESAQPLLETSPAVFKGSPDREKVDIESSIPKGSKERMENEGQEQKEKRRFRSLSFVDSFTMNLNMLDRDANQMNEYSNVGFEEVLSEPRVNQSLDIIWKLVYVVFAGTKFWVYRGLTAVLGIPFAFIWGLIFSLICLASVWFISPCLRIVDLAICIIRRVWTGLTEALLDPIFQSVARYQVKKSTLMKQEHV